MSKKWDDLLENFRKMVEDKLAAKDEQVERLERERDEQLERLRFLRFKTRPLDPYRLKR